MPTFHVKTGDEVKILTGKYRGKTGKVTQVFPKLHRVVVEGVNVTKRHLRTRREGEAGRIVEFSMPIHASNVARTEAKAVTPEAKPKRARTAKKSA
jgi:large subunit ribosomal protein L24